MNVVVAIDSFKGSLSSIEAGNAVREAILKIHSDADVKVLPMADGGEGTVEAMCFGLGGELVKTRVKGPLCKDLFAKYCILREKNTAIMEMSAAAGITLISQEERNPIKTTTYGVGEMILDAISKGVRHFVIGIGGSATNDGGVGMLTALGYAFLDKNGNPIPLGAGGLEKLSEISLENVHPLLKECDFRIACDVKNTLCGENGCSAVFGPQKGATPEMIKNMDAWLENYAVLSGKILPKADMNAEGTGAAGGLGFAFLCYTNAVLEPGVKIILEEIKLEDYIKNADLVVTGEGRLDSQTIMGKAPIGVARLAKKYNKPVIAFSGCVTDGASVCNEHGIDAFFPIMREVTTLEEALDKNNAYKNLFNTAEQVFRLIKI